MSANANSGATPEPAPKRQRTGSGATTVQHFADPTPHSPGAIQRHIDSLNAELAKAQKDLQAACLSREWRRVLAEAPCDVGDGPNGHIAATIQSEVCVRNRQVMLVPNLPDNSVVLCKIDYNWGFRSESFGNDNFESICHYEVSYSDTQQRNPNVGSGGDWIDTEKLAMGTQDKALQLRHMFAPASSCKRGKVVMLVAVSSDDTAQFAAAVVHMV